MPDTKVNTSAANSVTTAVVNTTGGHVVIWTGPDTGGDVLSRAYDANGVAVGGVTTVNTVTDGRQANFQAVQLANGGYVVLWTDQPTGTGDTEIRARVYDASGVPTGAQFNVTEAANSTSTPLSASGLADGGFVMAWRTTGIGAGDYVGRFTVAGAMREAVALPTGGATSVSGLEGGGYIVARSDFNPSSQGPGATIRVTRFGADGVQQGSPAVISQPDYPLGPSLPRMVTAALHGGGYVVSWTTGQGMTDIYVQQYDAAGALVMSGRGNTTIATSQYAQDIIPLADGGYFLTWNSGHIDLNNHGFGQRYDAAGARIGSEIPIAENMTLNQYYVAGAALEDGHVAFAWRSGNPATTTDVYQTVVDIVDGTPNAETLTGSAGRDFIYGYGGNDTINGGDGADMLYGGDGDDVLNGGAGDDILDGGPGDDIINGGTADTRNTVSYASATAGVTVDLTVGRATGGGGNDILTGIRDVIGSSFGDTITSIGHGSVQRGMGGDDVFHFGDWASDAQPPTTFDGGDGMDLFSFAEAFGPVTADLAFSTITMRTPSGWNHDGNIISIEGFIGSGYGDTLRGDGGANWLKGEDGNDKLYGEGGDDILEGGDVDDILDGGTGHDFLSGGAGSDVLYGMDGNDVLVGGGGTSSAPDYYYGGAGNDTYYVASTLTGPLDLVFEGVLFTGSEAGANDIDIIHSTGQFFWDYYSVGEYLYIDNAIDGGAYLVGGKDVASKTIYGSSGTDYISTYGGDARVDAGAGSDAISFELYGLDESYRGSNTVVMKAGSGADYVYEFRSGVDHIDLTAFNFGITGQQVLDQAVNVDNPGTADDYCYFYLTNAGGVDNYIVFMGLLSSQLQASDFVT